MGLTFIKAKISNPARPGKRKELEFLIDSGALYSVVPAEILKRLGIKSTSEEEFILANGEVVRKHVGNAFFEYGKKVRGAPVIFGEKGVYLMGATTLEALGFALDPFRRQLKPLPMLMM
ncbi:MAG: retropepsin-like domain-containing protein [Deltaproteobacteria bacterium]|nr:retropepsin-like domain-containing protein [Deltaproteobacteria bacterium]